MSMSQREYEARSVYALERIADALEKLVPTLLVEGDAEFDDAVCRASGGHCGRTGCCEDPPA